MEACVNDIGTEIILDCGVDVSTATIAEIAIKSPDGKVSMKEATAEGNFIKYITVSGDFHIPGKYHAQARVTMPGWSGGGELAEFFVGKSLM